MDLDCIITNNIDHLVARNEDIVLLEGSANTRKYNGSLLNIKLGSRPNVFTDITPQELIKASEVYTGSDQAWMYYKLSLNNEAVFTKKDGVYRYSDKFVRTNTKNYLFTPPSNLCILFFPGYHKMTPDITTNCSNHQFKHVVARCLNKQPKICAFKDNKHWSEHFNRETKAPIVDNLDDVEFGDGVFVRMRMDTPEIRSQHKQLIQLLNAKGCITLPTLQESIWYDDKVQQYSVLNRWTPPTWIFYDKTEAIAFAENAVYPIIHKLSHGASSHNVSLVLNKDEALQLIDNAFISRNYVYFQKYIKTDRDYRVTICGKYIFGIVRHIRSEKEPFASGSNNYYLLDFEDEHEKIAAYEALEISKALNSYWICYDFVFDGDVPYLLEISFAWGLIDSRKLFDYNLKFTGDDKNSYWKEAYSILEKQVLGAAAMTKRERRKFISNWRELERLQNEST